MGNINLSPHASSACNSHNTPVQLLRSSRVFSPRYILPQLGLLNCYSLRPILYLCCVHQALITFGTNFIKPSLLRRFFLPNIQTQFKKSLVSSRMELSGGVPVCSFFCVSRNGAFVRETCCMPQSCSTYLRYLIQHK